MNISDINFSKVVFPLEKELLDVCDGDIDEFQRLIDIIGKMTFEEDFSFSDVDRLIKANRGYKKELKRSALNDRFVERILPAIKRFSKTMDYKSYGGALFLGVKKPVVKAHGSSDKLLFEYTIIQAEKFVENKAVDKMIEEFNKQKETK